MNQTNQFQIPPDEPLARGLYQLSAVHPEWLRIPEATKLFGLSRSKLYELISTKRIKSFCLRERGKIKGVRLLSFDSISQFLESEAKAQYEVAPGGNE